MMTSMKLTESPDNQTTGKTETKGKSITDTECKTTTMERRHSLDSNSDEDLSKDDAAMAASPSKTGRTKKMKIEQDETALQPQNRSKTRNKSPNK